VEEAFELRIACARLQRNHVKTVRLCHFALL
jgi:hypothetical protein